MAAKPQKKDKLSTTPFDPLQPRFDTWGQLNQAARRGARAQIEPSLDTNRSQRRDARSAHQGRIHDINRGFDYYGDTLDNSFTDTRNALNNLAALRAGSSEAGRATLAGALGATAAERGSQDMLWGGGTPQAPPDMSSMMGSLGADYASGEAGNFDVTNMFGNAVARMGADRALAPLGRLAASDAEGRRFRAADKELEKQRSDIMTRLGSLTEQERQQLYDQALRSQNQGFTQDLAGKELNLKVREFKHQARVDRANLSINRDQIKLKQQEIQAQIDQAGSASQQGAAKLKLQAFNTGVNLLSSYLKPASKTEKKHPDQIAANRNPRDAYNLLVHQAGLPSRDAIDLIHGVPQWSHWSFKSDKRIAKSAGRHPTSGSR